MPPGLARYVVLKGSVTVDGVSLTVSGLGGTDEREPWFEVSLIPTTLEMTTLGRLQPGSQVNLEVDVIAKYVESLLRAGPASCRRDGVRLMTRSSDRTRTSRLDRWSGRSRTSRRAGRS